MKHTDYLETATDYSKYYSNCVFLSKEKNAIYVTSDLFPSTDIPNEDEDEDERGIIRILEVDGYEYSLISLESVSGDRIIPGIVAKKYSLDKRFVGETIVHPSQLSFYKIIGSYGINSKNQLGLVKFINVGTYKKGISRGDYQITPTLIGCWWQTLFSPIKFPSKEELYNKLDALFKGEIDHILLTNRYAIVKDQSYKYPVLAYLGTVVGHLNSPTNIKIAVKGKVAKTIGGLINERSRTSRSTSSTKCP